jgi:RimJ/RimL family protein N-acetyltransferase
MEQRSVAGREHLALVTRLLQRIRLADPSGGVWEAADLQWWWRRDQHQDPAAATFWVDDGEPVAAAIITDWGDIVGADVLAVDDRLRLDVAWPLLVERLATLGDRRLEVLVRDDDEALATAVLAAGFVPGDVVGVSCWLDAGDAPGTAALPEGFALRGRDELAGNPHHMIPRNGAQVAARLAECSLYRPDLDLAVVAPDGSVAAYGLFWADPVTGVGLVEPMRTEDDFQGRGLGRCVLTAGLQRLAAAGCTRCKISYLTDNEASRRLYLGVGFRPGAADRTYVR